MATLWNMHRFRQSLLIRGERCSALGAGSATRPGPAGQGFGYGPAHLPLIGEVLTDPQQQVGIRHQVME